MTTLPSPPVFSVQDNPDLDPKFLGRLSDEFDVLHNALGAVPDSSSLADLPFLTPASGNATVELKNPLSTKPAHVFVSNVQRADGAAITAAWAWNWTMKSSLIVVTFIGLAASTKFLLTAKVE